MEEPLGLRKGCSLSTENILWLVKRSTTGKEGAFELEDPGVPK